MVGQEHRLRRENFLSGYRYQQEEEVRLTLREIRDSTVVLGSNSRMGGHDRNDGSNRNLYRQG